MTVTAMMLLALALLGGGWDIVTRRIPNWLTFPIALSGLAWNSYTGGWHGLLTSLAGMARGIAILLPFFILGGTGAGDVKMLGAAGACAGGMGLTVIFIYFALLGGVIALAIALAYGRAGAVIRNTQSLVGMLGRGRWQQDGRQPRARDADARRGALAVPRLPYGAVIGVGCLLFLWIGPRTL